MSSFKISPKRCKAEERCLLSKRNVLVCAKVPIERQKEKGLYVAGLRHHCQYDLKTGSWSPVQVREVPEQVRYAEESGFLYQVFRGNPILGLGYRIERTSLLDKNKPIILFKFGEGKGEVLEMAVDGTRDIVFFVGRQAVFYPVSLYKKVADTPAVKVDVEYAEKFQLSALNSNHGTLYCLAVPRAFSYARRVAPQKAKLAELTYDGSLVTTITLPKDKLIMIEYDKHENSIYILCERQGTSFSNLYKFNGASMKHREAVVVKAHTQILLLSYNFIYALGRGGLIYSKDLKLVGKITGRCGHVSAYSGYILY